MGKGEYLKYKIEDIISKLKKNGLEWLDGEYVNSHSKILVSTEEGYKSFLLLSTFMNRGCTPKIFDKKNPYTIDNIKIYLEKNYGEKYKVISTSYEGNDECLDVVCSIHGSFKAPWKYLKKGQGCPNCSTNKPFTFDRVKNELKEINPSIIVLKGEVENRRSILTCKCDICGNIWESNVFNLISNKCGCPECKRRLLVEINTKEKIKIKCHYCKTDMEVRPSSIHESGRRFCSKECELMWRKEYYSGENSPNWNNELTDEERILKRGYLEYSEWRKSVYERDNYTCQCCGNKGIYLNAHHLNSYDWDKEHRTDIDNGVTLCKECHKRFHKKYGYGNNTKEQFDEFNIIC